MIELSAPSLDLKTSVSLAGSKSLSNRLLVLKELHSLELRISNLSEAEDTELLKKAFQKINSHAIADIDIGHAGTDLRFLTAFLALKQGEWTLTGSERIRERPIAPLVNALILVGANISYLEKENFPPLKIIGKVLKGGHLRIQSDISSQFVSALLLIAPSLECGLELTLTGSTVSFPYIRMTLELLKEFGASCYQSDNVLRIPAATLHWPEKPYVVEPDWSSASYWYSLCALSQEAEIELPHLPLKSLQADVILPHLFDGLGVNTSPMGNKLVLTRKKRTLHTFEYDFTDCPDIAQTLAVTCFGLGVPAHLKGLKTLKIKETDRLSALKTELEKFGGRVRTTEDSLFIEGAPSLKHEIITVDTYRDHRMAMSFAPLSLIYHKLRIKDPTVVDKSYPRFWKDLKSAGFSVNLLP